MYAAMYHRVFPTCQKVVATAKTEEGAAIASEYEAQIDPDTEFWYQEVPEETRVGSCYYPNGFHPPALAEWIHPNV